MIDFGCSSFCDKTRLDRGEEFSRNKRFWSVLSYHGFSEFFFFFLFHNTLHLPFINNKKNNSTIAQSQRDDLESLGYLLSALFQGSLPWDAKTCQSRWGTWRMKMSTPGSTLFRDMDPSFLEYWKDVRSLAFNEEPDYCSLKSRFVQCWERRGFGGSPGEYDWVALFRRFVGNGQEKTLLLLEKAPEIPPVYYVAPISFCSLTTAKFFLGFFR